MKGAPVVAEQGQTLEMLVGCAQAGDWDAFDKLISFFEKKVMKTALYLTGNLADAEDVAQEVYIKIFQQLPKLRQISKVEHWVYRMTVNVAHDLHRKRRIWGALSNLLIAVMPSDPIIGREIHNHLIEALGQLSFNERSAFILKELHDLEATEVAGILECKPVTVRGYLHSARKKLRVRLSHFKENP